MNKLAVFGYDSKRWSFVWDEGDSVGKYGRVILVVLQDLSLLGKDEMGLYARGDEFQVLVKTSIFHYSSIKGDTM